MSRSPATAMKATVPNMPVVTARGCAAMHKSNNHYKCIIIQTPVDGYIWATLHVSEKDLKIKGTIVCG